MSAVVCFYGNVYDGAFSFILGKILECMDKHSQNPIWDYSAWRSQDLTPEDEIRAAKPLSYKIIV